MGSIKLIDFLYNTTNRHRNLNVCISLTINNLNHKEVYYVWTKRWTLYCEIYQY